MIDEFGYTVVDEGDVTEQNVENIPPIIQKRLNTINNIYKNFMNNITKIDREPRATSILIQIIFEFYINEILEIKEKTQEFKDLRYDEKIKKLQELNIWTSNWKDDF